MQKTIVLLSANCPARHLRPLLNYISSKSVRHSLLRRHAVLVEYAGIAFGVNEVLVVLSTATMSTTDDAVLYLRELIDEWFTEKHIAAVCRTTSIFSPASDQLHLQAVESLQTQVISERVKQAALIRSDEAQSLTSKQLVEVRFRAELRLQIQRQANIMIDLLGLESEAQQVAVVPFDDRQTDTLDTLSKGIVEVKAAKTVS